MKTVNTRSRSKLALYGTAGLACAACCAPLVLPFILGGGALAGGAAAWAEWGELAGLALLTTTAIAGYIVWRRRRIAARTCGCAPDGGCNTGASCDLPAKQQVDSPM